MKLSTWAKKQGICYTSAWRMAKKGQIPIKQLPTGTIIVLEDMDVKEKPEYTVTYSRVSSSENKTNLKYQSKRLSDFCFAKGWTIQKEITEIGSGLNDNRVKLLTLLKEGKVTRLVVEHKDRLSRFGVKYIEVLCKHIGCELIIINEAESEKEDLIQDFISVITSFCARIYGQRRSKRKTEQLIRELEK